MSATVWAATSIRAASAACCVAGRTAFRHMGGDKLGIDAGRIDDGEAGYERNEHEAPAPGRDAPAAGKPSGRHELKVLARS
jgi:hypothetical protein